MVGADSNLCPSPDVLGAFIEGTADLATRRAVQRHLVNCPECVFVVGETNSYLSAADDEEPAEVEEEAPAKQWWWSALAAAAVAMVCLLAAWYAASRRDPLERLRHVVASLSARAVEGRLDGFAHRRYDVSRSAGSSADPTFRIEAERVARLNRDDARGLHARGVAALLLGRANEAITMLRKATELDPANATYWNDLSAAQLAADEGPSRAALTAARRATSLDPTNAAARFNEALALDRLGDEGAHEAWTRYLAVDGTSPWSTEATERRNSLLH
jgi:tetratricopeptide (TPR) repeat protein